MPLSDLNILKNKIESISADSREHIDEITLWDDKKLYILKNTYSKLPPQLSLHNKVRLKKEQEDALCKLMKEDISVRNFLCINIQYFFSLFENHAEFFRYFSRDIREFNLKINSQILNEIKKNCIDEIDEEFNKSKIFAVKFFGFSKNDSKFEKEIDCHKVTFCKLLQIYFFRNLNRFKYAPIVVNYTEDILIPFIKICATIGIGKNIKSNAKKDALYIDEKYIQIQDIQNFFCCFQYHSFFEKYVNSFFIEKGVVIDNPIILFNPGEYNGKHRKTIEGYFELDGSLCLTKSKKLLLIECKNEAWMHSENITHFIGKVNFIERIYGISIEKRLFSTGKRFNLWKDITDYPSCDDIKIYCIESFKKEYSDMTI